MFLASFGIDQLPQYAAIFFAILALVGTIFIMLDVGYFHLLLLVFITAGAYIGMLILTTLLLDASSALFGIPTDAVIDWHGYAQSIYGGWWDPPKKPPQLFVNCLTICTYIIFLLPILIIWVGKNELFAPRRRGTYVFGFEARELTAMEQGGTILGYLILTAMFYGFFVFFFAIIAFLVLLTILLFA